ncbi:glutathione S-transferase kappa 1 [Aplysia californica]|uniref:Glutathione S-transferase kappa n=1 Tax=Aplysia californica TaxID=6500 RepID=A0ABM0K5G2_APLCA|nr:glutathione S-transferase kappa 1 [Aplysia californica]
MSKRTVQFFYDVVSPYSLFAFEVLCRYKNVWNLDIKWRPFFLGGIMQGSGNKPPAANPNKAIYTFKDSERIAKYFDVPYKVPPDPTDFMFNNGSMTAQRFLCLVDMERPEMLEQITRELWMRAWAREQDIVQPDGIAAAATAAGLPKDITESFLSRVKSDEVKKRLRDTTQEALDLGAFGSPIIVFDVNGQKEWVFGCDRFPIMAHMMGLKWEGPKPGSPSKL